MVAEKRVQRRLAAILAADVVGYSRLMGEDEEGTLARLNALRSEILHPKISEYGGRIVKTTGDGTLIEFPSAVDAVNHAIDVQRALARRAAEENRDSPMEFRMGINVGDVIIDGDDIFGDGVNVAARIEAIAEPGGISISGTVYDQVRGKLDLPFRDLGEQSLKNIAEPIRVITIPVASQSTVPQEATGASAFFARPAVAVLPFQNMSDDSGQEYFSDGLSEDLITALSLWRSFPVIARNSSFAYQGQSPDIRKVGKELGARYVIEGSVRKAGNRIRVTAQLINAETGHHIWAERFDRDLSDIFDLQDEISARVAATVVPELQRAEHKSSAAKQPRNLDAWDYVQRGMAHLHVFSKKSNSDAREMFGRALQIDHRYSQACSGTAYSYARDHFYEHETSRREEIRSKCMELARRAVEFDDHDAMAHAILGIAYDLMRQNEDAHSEYLKAHALNPSNSMAVTGLGLSLINMGRPDEGIPYIERALQLNPQDARNQIFLCFIARGHFTARRYETAIEFARKAVQEQFEFPDPHIYLAVSLAQLGNTEEARKEYEIADRLHPGIANPSDWTHSYSNVDDNEHFLDGLRKAGWEG
jgi:adenylate cyclase